jgi:hypothetical protein
MSECPVCGRPYIESESHDPEDWVFGEYVHKIDETGLIPVVADYCTFQGNEDDS